MLQLGYHFHSVAMDGLNHMSQKGVYMSNVDSSAKYDKTSSIFQASSQDFMSSNAKFDLSPFSRNYNVYSSGRDTPPPKLERFDESSLAEHQVNGLSPPVLTPNTAVDRKSGNFQADYQRPNYGSVVSLCSISDSPSSKTGEFQHFDFKTAEQFNRVQSLPSSLSAKTPSTPRAASRKIRTQLQKGTLPGTLKHSNAVSVDILSDTSEEELPNFGYLFKHKHSKDSAVVIDHKTSPGQLAVTHRKNGVHSLISPIKNSAVERADFGNVSDIPELIHRKDSVSPCHGDVYPIHWESDRLKGCIDRNITASSACVSSVQNTNGTVSPLANGKVHEKRGEKRKDSVNNLQNGCSPKQKKVSSVIHNTDGATVLHNSKQPNEKFDINGNLKMCFDKKMHEKRKMLTLSEDVRNRYRAENFNGEPTANLAKSQSNKVSDVDFGKTNKLGTCTSGQNRRGHCIENEILHHSQLQSQGQRSERSCHQYNRDTTPDSKTLKNTVNGHHRMNWNKLSLSERNIKKTHQEKVGLKANGHQNPKVQKVRKPESVRHGHEKLTNGEVKTKVSVNQSKPVSQPVKSCPTSRQMKSPVSPKTQSQPNPMKLTPSPTKPLLNQAKLKTGPIKKSSSQSQVAHMEHSKNVLSSSRKAKPNDSAIEAVKPSKHQQKTVPFPNQPKFSSKTVSSDAKPVTGFEKSLSLPAKSEKVEKIHNASRNPKSVLTEKLSSTNTLTTPNRPASGKTTTSRFMKKQSGKHRSSPVTSESYQSVILLSSASDSSDSERTLEDKQPILHTLTRELLQRSEFQRKKSTTGQSNGKMNPSNGKMNPSVPQVGKQIKEEHSSKLNAAVLCKKEESETESPVIPRKRQESMFILDEIILDSSSDSDSELTDTCFDARGKKSGFDHDSDLLDINFDVLRETNRSQEKTKHVTPSSSGQKNQRTQKPEKNSPLRTPVKTFLRNNQEVSPCKDAQKVKNRIPSSPEKSRTGPPTILCTAPVHVHILEGNHQEGNCQRPAESSSSPTIVGVQSRHLNGTTDVKLSFGSKHLNTIEACQDEGHHEAAVQLIQDFVSSERKPPKAILKYLVKDVLLESKSKALTSSVYATLKHIQNLHPELESDVDLWNWNFLSGVVEKILHSPEKETEVYNNVLCLEYIISVLENNLEVYARFPQKSIISHYLAEEMQGHRLNSLVTWMIDCVKIKFSPETVSYESHSRSEHVARLLTLLQKLLEMSVVVTRNPSDSATKVAEEMVYQYLSLPSLKCRQLFLETMGSHLVRAKLLELLLENCCELDSSSYNEVRSPGHWAALSARKILEHHFKRKPVNNPFSACPNESDNSLQQVREAEACEELVMILYCLLQSHLRCVHGKLHLSLTLLYHDDSARSQSSQSSSQSSVGGSLASDDLQCLNEIHSHIVQLRDRLSTYCQNFTHKTKLLFHLMEVFKDFGQD